MRGSKHLKWGKYTILTNQGVRTGPGTSEQKRVIHRMVRKTDVQ